MSKKSHKVLNPYGERKSKKVDFRHFLMLGLWKTPKILVLSGFSVEILVENVENSVFEFSLKCTKIINRVILCRSAFL